VLGRERSVARLDHGIALAKAAPQA